MAIKIVYNLEGAMAVSGEEVLIFQQSPESTSSFIFASREWANKHRAALKELDGYLDYGYNIPTGPAQIQVYMNAEQTRTAIEQIIR